MIADVRLWARRHPRKVDVLLVMALCGLAVLSTTMREAPRIVRWPPLPAALVAACSSSALFAHRRYPRLTVIATTAFTAVLGAMGPRLGYEFGSTVAGPVMTALASLAWRTDSRTATRYTAASALVLLAVSTVWSPNGIHVQPDQVGLLGLILLPGAVADAMRSRRDYVTAVEARAEMAERTREEEARTRVGAERIRIARELHDVVAHHITLAHAQAATAEYLLATTPDKAQHVTRNLTATLVSALGELRATVGLLRQSEDPRAPTEPAPGLSQLAALLASFDHAGLNVTLTRDGAPRTLSPGVGLTAYRIVQEALTNVTKHALTKSASVHLAYDSRLLTLTISDDGQQAQAPGAAGYGLTGMRERAQAVGGRLRARPRSGTRGFEVIAELPAGAPHPAGLTAHDHKETP